MKKCQLIELIGICDMGGGYADFVLMGGIYIFIAMGARACKMQTEMPTNIIAGYHIKILAAAKSAGAIIHYRQNRGGIYPCMGHARQRAGKSIIANIYHYRPASPTPAAPDFIHNPGIISSQRLDIRMQSAKGAADGKHAAGFDIANQRIGIPGEIIPHPIPAHIRAGNNILSIALNVSYTNINFKHIKINNFVITFIIL